MFNLTRATEFAQLIISQYISEGDIVIDCTMGNGHDTLYMAKLVGEKGRVISFDIQMDALINTKSLLIEENAVKQVVLINDSHEHIDLYVQNRIAGAMFNLGYLPRGNINITTKANSTLTALKKCISILKSKGIITLVIYYAHTNGNIEKDAIIEFVESLDPKRFHVIQSGYINQTNYPPIIITIIKKGV